jgi:hypothetical protein
MKTCDYGAREDAPGCGREAQYQAVLHVRPFKGCAPTISDVDWHACGRHAKLATVDDIVSETGWKYIVDDHKRNGRLPPAKQFTSVRFKRV